MNNPINYWYQKYIALKAKMDEMTAGEEHLASACKMSPNDLEEYASHAGFDYVDNIVQEHPGHRFNDHDVEYAYRDGIIAGAKWQAEKDVRDMYMSDNRHFEKVYQLGRTDMREQMMKEAVEVVVWDAGVDFAPHPVISVEDFNVKDGDKVRIIIVKEEENGTE